MSENRLNNGSSSILWDRASLCDPVKYLLHSRENESNEIHNTDFAYLLK